MIITKRDNATFNIGIKRNKNLALQNKSNTTCNFNQKVSYNSINDKQQKGSLQESISKGQNSFTGSRKGSMNIYDIRRENFQKEDSKMKVFDSKGKSYLVSRTVLTEEDSRGNEIKNRGSVTSLQIKSKKLDKLDIYLDGKINKKEFKMSGFLRDKIEHGSNYELNQSQQNEINTSELDSYAIEESEEFEEQKKIKKKKMDKMRFKPRKVFNPGKRKHRRSKTGVISQNLINKTKNKNLGNLLLSDDNESSKPKTFTITKKEFKNIKKKFSLKSLNFKRFNSKKNNNLNKTNFHLKDTKNKFKNQNSNVNK